MFGIVLFRIWHFVSAKNCIYVALSGLILAKNFATRQNNYNLTLTHQSGPFPCCYTLVVRVYTIYISILRHVEHDDSDLCEITDVRRGGDQRYPSV